MKPWEIALIAWSAPVAWVALFMYARGERRNGYGEYSDSSHVARVSPTNPPGRRAVDVTTSGPGGSLGGVHPGRSTIADEAEAYLLEAGW